MEVILAKSAGFCFGVDRAMSLLNTSVQEGAKVCTLGPIIHNTQVVEELSSRGVRIINIPEEAGKDEIVVIRSHGVGRETYETFRKYGIKYIDATCPFVSKIHRIVNEFENKDGIILIAGDRNHPEIIGIIGHCRRPVYVFDNLDELLNILKNIDNNTYIPIIMLSQTTFCKSSWKNCIKVVSNLYTNIKIFDTICNATDERQREAEYLAKNSDLMLIIGGRHSSNTKKLKEVCDAYTKALLIETAADICVEAVLTAKKIGITAGASTPAYIIKEVLIQMEEIVKDQEELSFEELLDQNLNQKLYTGKRVTGVITSVLKNEAHADIGAKQTGIIAAAELTDDPNLRPEDVVKPGDEAGFVVISVNDAEGIVNLSKKRYDSDAGFAMIKAAGETGDVQSGVITDVVRGGVLCLSNSIKVFIPASQVSDSKVENLETLLKQKVEFKIIEVNEDRRRAVGSIKAVLKIKKQAEKEKFWAEAKIGNTYSGTVKSLTSYGVFVDIGGVDGMVHITELSWSKIKHPSEIVNVGDIVEVYIKDINEEKKKISLGYRKTEDNPWNSFPEKYSIGQTVSVKVVSITSFGAFAQIVPGIDGLIHISQLSDRHVVKVSDAVKPGDEMNAKITDIDVENKRISLSVKAVLEDIALSNQTNISDELEGVQGVEFTPAPDKEPDTE